MGDKILINIDFTKYKLCDNAKLIKIELDKAFDKMQIEKLDYYIYRLNHHLNICKLCEKK